MSEKKKGIFSFFNRKRKSEEKKIGEGTESPTSTTSRWQVNKINVNDPEIQKKAIEFDLPPLVIKLLKSRDVDLSSKESLNAFIAPKKHMINDFKYMSSPDQIKKSMNRLMVAKKNGEKVIINGDPDADGIAGTTVLVAGLRFMGIKTEYDFPTRSKEGHGLQARIIEYAKANGIKLIITTDCGTKDVEAIEYAKSQDVDVIITDHHILGKKIPAAFAVINPYLQNESVNEHKLSGSFIAYKFVIAAAHYLRKALPTDLKDYMLAVSCLGALSDRITLMNPLNRIMIKDGIRALNETQMEGIKALKKSSNIGDSFIKPREASRTIIPKLNAPGRIGDKDLDIPDSNVVVDLLLLGTGKMNEKRADKIINLLKSSLRMKKEATHKHFEDLEDKVLTINSVAEKRRKITSAIEDEIQVLINALSHHDKRVIMIKGKNWNPGVIGIDADRIRERYLKPTIIFTSVPDSNYLRGSVRSIPTVNMYEILNEISEQYENEHNKKLFCVEVKTKAGKAIVNSFGGHPQACGFSVHKDNYEELLEKIYKAFDKLPEEELRYSYHILDVISLDDVKTGMVKKLDRISPFGQGFELPVFMLKGVVFSKKYRPFGSRYQKTQTPHVEFKLLFPGENDDKNARTVRAVGFGLWHKYEELVVPDKRAKFDLIFTMETYKSTRRNKNKGRRERVEVNVLDIRKSN